MNECGLVVPAWPGSTPEEEAALGDLVARLAAADGSADEAGTWPEGLWRLLVEAGAQRWALPAECGGAGLDRAGQVRRYARIAEGSLTAAFILTQHDAATRRLAAAIGPARAGAADWLARLAAGRAFATVGISQLTTSRRHGARALTATAGSGGSYRLDGVMPWVTAAGWADVLVTGAVLDDGRQLLVAVPTDRPGLAVQPALPLAALQASCTAEVTCRGVAVGADEVLAGPSLEVMAIPGLTGTGGLETSALALGLARAALAALVEQVAQRPELTEPAEALLASWHGQAWTLLAAAEGAADTPTPAQIRAQANALALRATQAYLTARKGTGFLRTEPAQRWARQALFFLVWSCPAPIAQSTLRDLAGICPA